MTRGDQRERDRAKAQEKNAQKIKAEGKSGDPLKRNENDAAALQAKVAAKKAAEVAAAANSNNATNSTTTASVVRKKVPTKSDTTIDDLLSSGLKQPSKSKKVISK